MKRSVTFDIDGVKVAGYEGGAAPIDKAAELVLSSTESPIVRLEVVYEDLSRTWWDVAWTSEEGVGPCQPISANRTDVYPGNTCLWSGWPIAESDGRCLLHAPAKGPRIKTN